MYVGLHPPADGPLPNPLPAALSTYLGPSDGCAPLARRSQTTGEPENLEPDKCEGWSWVHWSEPLPAPLFTSLAIAKEQNVDPFCSEVCLMGSYLSDLLRLTHCPLDYCRP